MIYDIIDGESAAQQEQIWSRKWKAEHGPSLGVRYMSAAQHKLEVTRGWRSEETSL